MPFAMGCAAAMRQEQRARNLDQAEASTPFLCVLCAHAPPSGLLGRSAEAARGRRATAIALSAMRVNRPAP